MCTHVVLAHCSSKIHSDSDSDADSDAQKLLVPVFVPPPDIVMTDFEKHKAAGDRWFSPPFYSHIGGYKMCLSVVAKGQGDGKATHASVFCTLTRGEHDDQLKWPFRGDITIQLLNQSSDEEHWEKTVCYEEEHAGRVVGKEGVTFCWGKYCFIAHTKLCTETKSILKMTASSFGYQKLSLRAPDTKS